MNNFDAYRKLDVLIVRLRSEADGLWSESQLGLLVHFVAGLGQVLGQIEMTRVKTVENSKSQSSWEKTSQVVLKSKQFTSKTSTVLKIHANISTRHILVHIHKEKCYNILRFNIHIPYRLITLIASLYRVRRTGRSPSINKSSDTIDHQPQI